MTGFSAIPGWIVALPLAGGLAVLAIPARHVRRAWIGARAVALVFGVGTLLLAAGVAGSAGALHETSQVVTRVGAWTITLDGLSLPLALLAAALAVIITWASYGIKQHLKSYFCLLQLFAGASQGVLSATNGGALCGFLAAAVVLLHVLIARWGGDHNVRAARRFLYVGMAAEICLTVGLWSRLGAGMFAGWTTARPGDAAWCFWLVLAGLGSLAALWPLHGWLAGAVAESCTPVAMATTAGLQTLAGYGLLRVWPLFTGPLAAHRTWVGVLGVLTLAYGTLAAQGQKQLKRMTAYLSTALMGFFLLGLATENATAQLGAVYLLTGRAVVLGMLVFVAGMIEDRLAHCEVARLGGLSGHMPGFARWSAVGMLGAAGLPGMCIFGGELLIVIGALQRGQAVDAAGIARGQFVWLAVAAAVGMVVLLASGVWTYQRVFLGVPRVEHSNVARMSASERCILAVLGGSAVIFGLAPRVMDLQWN